MFDASTLVTFILASFALAVVPGPNITVIIATALQQGRRAALAVVAGTQIGILSQVVVLALGFDMVLGIMGWAFDWIRLLGALYLIWLGAGMLRARRTFDGDGLPVAPRSLRQLAVRGFLVNWSNPKTLLFIGAFIPQFISASQPGFGQVLVLGLVFVAVTTLVDGVYGVLAGSAGRALTSGRAHVLSRISGGILIMGGVWLALQKKA